jgi:hypothetical protein
MTRPSLALVGPTRPSLADQSRTARSEARRHAVEAALAAISAGVEAAAMLRDLATLDGDLPVCVAADGPLLGRQMELTLERMAAAIRGEGRAMTTP